MDKAGFTERLTLFRDALSKVRDKRQDSAEIEMSFSNFHNWEKWNDWRNWNNPPQPGGSRPR